MNRARVREALLWGAVAMVVARLVGHFFLHDVAHAMDEAAYLFQAKTFIAGHVSMPSPEPRGAFNLWYVWSRGIRYSIFPPGWPAVLAPFLACGLENWANPFVHGVTVALGYLTVERHFPRADPRTGWRAPAHLGALLLLLSPQLVIQAASLMSHALLAACTVAVLFALPTERRAPIERWQAIAGGVAIAIAMLTRPLCAVALALTVGAVVLVRRHRVTLRTLIAFGIPLAAAGAIWAVYNRALTGSALTFPQTLYFETHEPPEENPVFRHQKGCNSLGFGQSHSCDIFPHTIEAGIRKVEDNIVTYSLLGGAAPIVLGALVLGWRLVRRQKREGGEVPFAPFAAICLPVTILLYSAYWNAGTCLGARFWHITLPPVLLAFAVAMARYGRRALVGLTAAVYVVTLGFACAEISGAYFGLDDRFHALKAHWSKDPALVMVVFADPLPRWSAHYRWTVSLGPDYRWADSIRSLSALAENEANPGGEIVFAKFHPALAEQTIAHYPGRTPLLYVVQDRAEGDFLTPYRASDWTELSGGGAAPNFACWALSPELRDRLQAAPGTFFHNVGIRERAP